MSQTWIVTVGAARLGAADAPAGLLVARALLADGVPVASRQIVDEDETAVEEALRSAVEAASLVVVLAHPGGSSGEVVRRALSRLTGARLVLNDKLLAQLEEDFARRGQAMPRRLDRLGLLPQGAGLWPGAGGAAPAPPRRAGRGRGRAPPPPPPPPPGPRPRRSRGAARPLARRGRAGGG